jgi:hypothetical protein
LDHAEPLRNRLALVVESINVALVSHCEIIQTAYNRKLGSGDYTNHPALGSV